MTVEACPPRSPPHPSVSRNKAPRMELTYFTSSTLEHTGYQLWRGALLLADFLVSRRQELHGRTVLEMGCGAGLVGIICGRYARRVFLTDGDQDSLQLASMNVERNAHLFTPPRATLGGREGASPALELVPEEERGGPTSRVTVRYLNWATPTEACFVCRAMASPPAPIDSPLAVGMGDFGWVAQDAAALQEVTWILASDVIYDDDLTDAFMDKLYCLLHGSKRVCFLAIEKRFNFCLEAFAVVATGYKRFLSHVQEEVTMATSSIGPQESRERALPPLLSGRRIPVDSVPPCFTRTALPPGTTRDEEQGGGRAVLELWELTSSSGRPAS